MRYLAAALMLLVVGSGRSTVVCGQTGASLARADFTVHDERGRPVATLGAGDIEVFEDGAPRRVVALRHSDVGAPATFVLFIDDLHLDFRSTPRTRDFVRRLLLLMLRSGDSVGVVTPGNSSISTPPTTDRGLVDARIRSITGSGLKAGELLDIGHAAERLRRADAAFQTLRSLLRWLEDVPDRRRVVIHISGGYESGHEETISSLARAAASAEAVIHTFEPGGLMGRDPVQLPPVDPGRWSAYLRDASDSLLQLANATGGQFVAAPTDIDAALRRISADARDYYRVQFEAAGPISPGAARRLEIRTTMPGLTVSHRTWRGR